MGRLSEYDDVERSFIHKNPAPRSTAPVINPEAAMLDVRKFLVFCRQTHVDWMNHLRECAHCMQYEIDYVGSIEHHQECIEGYNSTIAYIADLERRLATYVVS